MRIVSYTEHRIGDLNTVFSMIADGRVSPMYPALSLHSIGPLPFIDLIPNRHMLSAQLHEAAERIGTISLEVASTPRADHHMRWRTDGLVAVIVPTYNVQSFVAETLSSIECQDYSPLEMIIVDDGSEDATVDRICRFMQAHADSLAIRFVQIPHMGNPGLSRNIGLYNILAPGVEYVAFMDGDDLYASPSVLRVLVDSLCKQPAALAAFGDYDWISEDGTVIARASGLRKARSNRWQWRRSCELTWENIASANLSTYHLQSLMVRKGAPFLSYRPRGEDEEYYASLFRSSAKRYQGRLDGIAQVPELIAHYRKRQNSLSYKPIQRARLTPQDQENPKAGAAHGVPLFYELAGIPERYINEDTISRWTTKKWARLFWRAIFSGEVGSALRFMKCAISDPLVIGRHLAWIPVAELLQNPMAKDMVIRFMQRNMRRFVQRIGALFHKRTTRDATR